MISVQALSNTILMKSFEEDVGVSPMKLQRLIYLVYKDYMHVHKKSLFYEPFEPWVHGPVLSSLYYVFKRFGAEPITRFARGAMHDDIYVVDPSAAEITGSINKIWNTYKSYTGIQLSELTQVPTTAWFKAYKNNLRTLRDEDIRDEPAA